MIRNIAAPLALVAASSLNAQAIADLSTATPIDGSWNYAATADGSEASFVNAIGTPQLWLRCTRATRRVTIAKPAAAAAPLNIWTSSVTKSVPSSFDAASARLSSDLGAWDQALDALASSRGRIGFSAGTLPPLVVPAWPEVARVIEDCRA